MIKRKPHKEPTPLGNKQMCLSGFSTEKCTDPLQDVVRAQMCLHSHAESISQLDDPGAVRTRKVRWPGQRLRHKERRQWEAEGHWTHRAQAFIKVITQLRCNIWAFTPNKVYTHIHAHSEFWSFDKDPGRTNMGQHQSKNWIYHFPICFPSFVELKLRDEIKNLHKS